MIDGIHERDVFLRLAAETIRGRSGPLSVVITAMPGALRPNVAFAIPRRVGSAVVRNRLRRQLRVAATELADEGHLEGAAYLVIVRPGARGMSMHDLMSHLRAAVDHAVLRRSGSTETRTSGTAAGAS